MLANIIKLLHLILVLLIAIAPFYPDKTLKKSVFIFLLYLFFQYLTGYEKCGLTILEYVVMGENYQEGFLYRLIKPVINKPEKYFYRKLFIFHIIWIIILGYQINIISDIHKYFV